MKKILKRTMRNEKLNRIIPEGTEVTVSFPKEQCGRIVRFTTAEGISLSTRTNNIKQCIDITVPSEKTLYKWQEDGIGKSVSGLKVELDGWDYNGFPSWFLALGYI